MSEGVPLRATAIGGSAAVLVVVSGPGHHERATAAGAVVAALGPLAASVAVSADLRPRLAADVAGVLDAGADRVLLVGSTISALARVDQGSDAERESRHLVGVEVIVRLSPGPGPMRASVEDGLDTALGADVAQALAEVDLGAAVHQ